MTHGHHAMDLGLTDASYDRRFRGCISRNAPQDRLQKRAQHSTSVFTR
jgi:hypothetical protein